MAFMLRGSKKSKKRENDCDNQPVRSLVLLLTSQRHHNFLPKSFSRNHSQCVSEAPGKQYMFWVRFFPTFEWLAMF